ncbi:hypothetical protein ABZ922_16020 [Streptomyces shenzhenensis]|uniref:hypothetical protein n=1 Tax=Streptomyces shenzhenensis TaxID=943815 RepID=UPI0033DFEB56
MSDPVAKACALVRAECHTFHLADDERYDQPTFRPENGLIFSKPGLAVVLVGINSGAVNTTVEVYRHPVGRPDTDEWDEVVDHSIESISGHMRVTSLMDDPPELPTLTPFGPGAYRVRVHARGRERAYDAHVSEPVEDYLLQIWPGRHEPDAVHKQTDQIGAMFRRAADQPVETPSPPPEDDWERKARARLRRHGN